MSYRSVPFVIEGGRPVSFAIEDEPACANAFGEYVL